MASVSIDIDLDEVVNEAASKVSEDLPQDVESIVHEVLERQSQRDDYTRRIEDLERTVQTLVRNLERYRSTLLAIGIMDQPKEVHRRLMDQPKEDA
jgi:uncharacterized protein YlxW (UPF0749 family)